MRVTSLGVSSLMITEGARIIESRAISNWLFTPLTVSRFLYVLFFATKQSFFLSFLPSFFLSFVFLSFVFLSFFISFFLSFFQGTELSIDISGMDSNTVALYVIGTEF